MWFQSASSTPSTSETQRQTTTQALDIEWKHHAYSFAKCLDDCNCDKQLYTNINIVYITFHYRHPDSKRKCHCFAHIVAVADVVEHWYAEPERIPRPHSQWDSELNAYTYE